MDIVYDNFADEMWEIVEEELEQYLYETKDEAMAYFKFDDMQVIYDKVLKDYGGEMVDELAYNIDDWLQNF